MTKENIIDIVNKYLKKNNCSNEISIGYSYHIDRFYDTIERLKKTNFNGKVLEIGGYDAISDIIRTKFPDNRYCNTNFDLRHSFPYRDNSFDFIINTEVIEHLSPLDVPSISTFYPVSVENLLKECYRVLRPGGIMFLTTPNVTSYVIIDRVLGGYLPWMYWLHYKEYTVEQIREFLLKANFNIKYIETVYTFIPKDRLMHIENILKSNGYSINNRGDSIVSEVVK
jgi:SAM-dependent methyltransferase